MLPLWLNPQNLLVLLTFLFVAVTLAAAVVALAVTPREPEKPQWSLHDAQEKQPPQQPAQ